MAEGPVTTRTPCVEFSQLYQHPLVEEPPTSGAPIAERRQSLMMIQKAQELCAECPLMRQCLFDAVVRYDISGFAGGASTRQRAEIRARLGLKVAVEEFDGIAGVTAPNRQIDNREVVRLRAANPHESLEIIALRLGCSLSTVKRHLRKARENSSAVAPPKPAPPSVEAVMAAYFQVIAHRARRTRAA